MQQQQNHCSSGSTHPQVGQGACGGAWPLAVAAAAAACPAPVDGRRCLPLPPPGDGSGMHHCCRAVAGWRVQIFDHPAAAQNQRGRQMRQGLGWWGAGSWAGGQRRTAARPAQHRAVSPVPLPEVPCMHPALVLRSPLPEGRAAEDRAGLPNVAGYASRVIRAALQPSSSGSSGSSGKRQQQRRRRRRVSLAAHPSAAGSGDTGYSEPAAAGTAAAATCPACHTAIRAQLAHLHGIASQAALQFISKHDVAELGGRVVRAGAPAGQQAGQAAAQHAVAVGHRRNVDHLRE